MDDNVDLSIRQFTEAWRLMCAGSAAATVAAIDGVQYIFSGTPIAFFNVAIVTQRGVSGSALQSHGERACAWASDKGVPWLFVVTKDALEPGIDAASILDVCGLAPAMSLTGM